LSKDLTTVSLLEKHVGVWNCHTTQGRWKTTIFTLIVYGTEPHLIKVNKDNINFHSSFLALCQHSIVDTRNIYDLVLPACVPSNNDTRKAGDHLVRLKALAGAKHLKMTMTIYRAVLQETRQGLLWNKTPHLVDTVTPDKGITIILLL
jgi:hypothetical protein